MCCACFSSLQWRLKVFTSSNKAHVKSNSGNVYMTWTTWLRYESHKLNKPTNAYILMILKCLCCPFCDFPFLSMCHVIFVHVKVTTNLEKLESLQNLKSLIFSPDYSSLTLTLIGIMAALGLHLSPRIHSSPNYSIFWPISRGVFEHKKSQRWGISHGRWQEMHQQCVV